MSGISSEQWMAFWFVWIVAWLGTCLVVGFLQVRDAFDRRSLMCEQWFFGALFFFWPVFLGCLVILALFYWLGWLGRWVAGEARSRRRREQRDD